MIPKVLIIDDDQSMLRLLEKELEEYSDFFSVETTTDGQEALNILSGTDISLIITDLRMPGIDGFEFLGIAIRVYPDIPVMAMTAYDRPKTKDVVMKSGAVDYMTKPVEALELFRRVRKLLKKQQEGGSLNRVSLETYLQLVEMEEQTCTLRIVRQSGGRKGVLFFKNGQLMDARIGDRKGLEAAYEILSWSAVSLSIENDCPVKEKFIDGELQAILLDAMRSKDEGAEEPEPDAPVSDAAAPAESRQKAEASPAPDTGNRAESPAVGEKAGNATEGAESHGAGVSGQSSTVGDENMSPAKSAEKKLVAAMGGDNGIQDVYSDSASEGLVYQVESLGQLFESGVLNVIYINRHDRQVLVVPDQENVVVMLDPNVPREAAIAVFS